MSTITTIAGTDVISTSRGTINTNFSNLNTDKIETSVLDTDTTLAANSDAKIATQKATKAYADSVAGANASQTAKGNVEIATAAQIDAGTGTGETGAVIVLSPDNVNSAHNIPFVAPGTSGNIMTSNGIDWTSATNVPSYQQQLYLPTVNFYGIGSSQDGSVVYIAQAGPVLSRYERDSATGAYLRTHEVSINGNFDGVTGIIQIGSYVYLFKDDNTNVSSFRYLAADLTGQQSMTVPTVTSGNDSVAAWTDGTYAYIVANASDTTSRKWSVSGTTFTAVGTATVTTNIFANGLSGSMWDGTNAYIIDNSISTTAITIRKLTNIDGSSYTTTTKNFPVMSSSDYGAFIANINTTKMYVGKFLTNYDQTSGSGSSINIVPITKP